MHATIAFVIPLRVLTVGLSAQEIGGQLWTLGNNRVRIVFPSQGAVDSGTASKLMAALVNQAPLPGLPAGILSGKRMTISLAAELPAALEGRSYPDRHLIVLPFADAPRWRPEKLQRVMRHELAHIGLGVLLDYAPLPRWFDEGFAEWAAGPPTCESEARIRIELMMRRRQGQPPPQLVDAARLGTLRLFYDFLSTFFEYIDQGWSGVVSDGTLLNAVKAHGLESGLSHVLGQNAAQLEMGWQSYLLDRYAGLPERWSCESGRS